MNVDFEITKNDEYSDKNSNALVAMRKNELRFKQKLIKEVQRHRPLYDTRHKGFFSTDAKTNAWQKIATELGKDVKMCIATWMDIRYNYQNYVRKLRKFLHSNNMSKKKRPIIEFERDLLFLWRFVADRSRCRISSALESKKDTTTPIAKIFQDDVIVEAQNIPEFEIHMENNEKFCIRFQENNEINENGCIITPELRRLVELIKEYPELYDVSHRYYNDYYRKGIIWNALSNELNERATKLIKLWICVQTRYEWEIREYSMRKVKTELKDFLEFLVPFIGKIPNTVYKQSYYLKGEWHEPMVEFSHIVQLLSTMHTFRDPIFFAPEKQTEKGVFSEYNINKKYMNLKLWTKIGKMQGSSTLTPGRCEVTWLIMRKLHWELKEMRKHGYQLRDHWHFESIISDLYGYTKQLNVKKAEPIEDDITSNSYAYSIPIPEMIGCLRPTTLHSTPTLFNATPSSSSQKPFIAQSISISKEIPYTISSNVTSAQPLFTSIPASSITPKAASLATPPLASTNNAKIPTVPIKFIPAKTSLNFISNSSLTSTVYPPSVSTSNEQISSSLKPNQSCQLTTSTCNKLIKSNSYTSDKLIKSFYKPSTQIKPGNQIKETVMYKTNSCFIQKQQNVSINNLKSNIKIVIKPSNAQFVSTSNVRIPSASLTPINAQSLVTLIPKSSPTLKPALPTVSPLISISNEKFLAVPSYTTPLQSSPVVFSTSSIALQPVLPTISPLVSTCNKKTPTVSASATPAQLSSTLISKTSLTSQAALASTSPLVSTCKKKIPIVLAGGAPAQSSPTVFCTSTGLQPALPSMSPLISTCNKKTLTVSASAAPAQLSPIVFSTSSTGLQAALPSISPMISTCNKKTPTVSVSATPAQLSSTLISKTSLTSQAALASISPLVSTCNKNFPTVLVSGAPAKLFSTLTSKTSLISQVALPSISSSKQQIPIPQSDIDAPLETNGKMSTSTENMLYPNKMKIELVATPGYNLLIINSPTKKYTLPMNRTAMFIRYVMAIPHLHNKDLTLADTTKYWEYLSIQLDLPTYVCIACWDFLLDNFKYFDRIAPIRELMKPFPNFPDLKVWEEGYELCRDLDKLARSEGWIKYIDQLPALMSELQSHPEIQAEGVVPSTTLIKFQIPNAAEICTVFRNLFISYMKDLEKGIAHKWPQKWWRVLVQLAFLVHVHYNDQEPFYYIIKNKIYEEIERCTKVEKIWESNKITNVISSGTQKKNNLKSNGKVATCDTRKRCTNNLKSDGKVATCDTRKRCTNNLKSDGKVASCDTQSRTTNYLKLDKNFDPYKLIMNVRQRPYIYLNCTKEEKLKAWKQVAAKMNINVADCQRVFRRALKQFFFLKKRDIGGRCTINYSYYQNLLYIYDTVRRKKKPMCKKASKPVFPGCFLPDINMDSCRTRLVMKNWSYAIQKLPTTLRHYDSLCDSLTALFLKYRVENDNVNEVRH